MNLQNPAVQGGLVIGSISTLINAFIVLGRALGWWDDTVEKALSGFVAVAVPAAATITMAIWMNKRTISKENPVDEDGEKLVRKDTGGPTLYEEKKDLSRSIQR